MSQSWSGTGGTATVLLLGALSLAGCSPDSEPAGHGPSASATAPAASGHDRGLQAVALPDVSRADASVQQQLRAQYDVLQARLADPDTPALTLADAFGDMGKLLLAAEYLDASEPAFSNARALEPRDMRWPYYLAHVYRLRNQPETAAVLFEEALALKPDDVPALLWLGEMYLASNQPDRAEAPFARALAADPDLPMALYGLGRVALAREEFAEAVTRLERVLELAPEATRVEYQLGLAYRGLGNETQAQAHIARRGDVDLQPRDPLIEELGDLLQSAAAFALSGTEALTEGDFETAVADLTRAVELDPDNESTRLNLGSALVLSDDAAAAVPHLEAAVRLAPEDPRAHYALGILEESGTTADGRDRDDTAALEHFRTAVRLAPAAVEMRISLADALRRTDQLEESLSQYAEALRLDPAAASAQFGSAMALVRLGRWADARRWLEEGAARFPEQPGFAHALARLLAAAPDDRVRDGRRALLLLQPLMGAQSPTFSETMAMTMAELGDFDEAAAWQRNAMAATRQAGDEDLVDALSKTLARYEAGQPCRTPWRDDDPVFYPRPTMEP